MVALLKANDVVAVCCYEYFDRTYGNTYTSAQLEINGQLVATRELSYGTDRYTEDKAAQWLVANGYASPECKWMHQIKSVHGILTVTTCDKAKRVVALAHGQSRPGVAKF